MPCFLEVSSPPPAPMPYFLIPNLVIISGHGTRAARRRTFDPLIKSSSVPSVGGEEGGRRRAHNVLAFGFSDTLDRLLDRLDMPIGEEDAPVRRSQRVVFPAGAVLCAWPSGCVCETDVAAQTKPLCSSRLGCMPRFLIFLKKSHGIFS